MKKKKNNFQNITILARTSTLSVFKECLAGYKPSKRRNTNPRCQNSNSTSHIMCNMIVCNAEKFQIKKPISPCLNFKLRQNKFLRKANKV